jgi:hypothetical protein
MNHTTSSAPFEHVLKKVKATKSELASAPDDSKLEKYFVSEKRKA